VLAGSSNTVREYLITSILPVHKLHKITIQYRLPGQCQFSNLALQAQEQWISPVKYNWISLLGKDSKRAGGCT
jgi:hypothetical protein